MLHVYDLPVMSAGDGMVAELQTRAAAFLHYAWNQ